MRVVGYTYNADTHCVDCTRKYVTETLDTTYHYSAQVIDDILDGSREFGDSEGNSIHPIFSDSEASDTPSHCEDCGEFIDDSWIDTTVDYAVEALRDYIYKREGNTEVLDVWAENLKWCYLDKRGEYWLKRYREVRA